jgi:hypothetical protein
VEPSALTQYVLGEVLKPLIVNEISEPEAPEQLDGLQAE